MATYTAFYMAEKNALMQNPDADRCIRYLTQNFPKVYGLLDNEGRTYFLERFHDKQFNMNAGGREMDTGTALNLLCEIVEGRL